MACRASSGVNRDGCLGEEQSASQMVVREPDRPRFGVLGEPSQGTEAHAAVHRGVSGPQSGRRQQRQRGDGPELGQLERNPSAEGVSDHMRPIDTPPVEGARHGERQSAGIRFDTLREGRRVAEAGQVDGEHIELHG